MASQFEKLDDKHIKIIEAQKMFFVATAGDTGRVNLSPKGLDSFRVINESKVVWLNLTGSGNETAAHVRENHRMTIMFCTFEGQPMIVRLYGMAEAIHPRDKKWDELIGLFPEETGSRQIFELDIDLVQSSCGFGVPFYEYSADRPTLRVWAEKHGPEKIKTYWEDKNKFSIDDKDTGIIDRNA
jgi:hypothetical protein